MFVDGVGIAPADPVRNPIAAASLPAFQRLFGHARPVLDHLGSGRIKTRRAALSAIDATLGTPGRPQSGTGQTALLTGVNAPQRMGRHFGPWVPTSLRPLLADTSLFKQALARGHRVAFANAYPAASRPPTGATARRPGAFPFAAREAGILVRDEASIRDGDGLPSSITSELWRQHVDPAAPVTSIGDAARMLAAIVERHDLTVFAHYDTDYAGHRRDLIEGVRAIQRVDEFLSGLLENLPDDVLLIVTSDHGNLEDVSTGHTSNDVPLLAVGREAVEATADIRAITDVPGRILDLLDGGSG